MPRSSRAGSSALFTSMSMPPSRSIARRRGWPSPKYHLWLTARTRRVELDQLIEGDGLHAVLADRLRGLDHGVVDHRLDAELPELADDVRDLAVADVAAVLLEGQAEDADARALHRHVRVDEQLDELLGDERPHVVVDAPAGQDDLGLVAELLRLRRQVVWVDADAVAADQARREPEEVPLRAGGREHVRGADAHAIEDQRELVHQRDVEIALRVLDDLRRLGDLDARRPVHARLDDGAVGCRDALERGGVLAAHDLRDLLEACAPCRRG